MKRVLLLACSLITLSSCASWGNSNTNASTANKVQPDNPLVSSRAASSQDFPQENELTPATPTQKPQSAQQSQQTQQSSQQPQY